MKALRDWICRKFHGDVMYAGGRTYVCRTCWRKYAVAHFNEDKRKVAA